MVVFTHPFFVYHTLLVPASGEEQKIVPKLAYAKNMRAMICRFFYTLM